ncbi:MAG: Flp family type IVb pilin [Sneathiella sp.]
MFKMVRSFLKDESGATAIEYGLIAALVALAGIAAFTALGQGVDDAFQEVADSLCQGVKGNTTSVASATGCS